VKISVAVVCGGKSVEHEVSIISAVQAMANLDETKYNVVPVYLTKDNEFYTGDKLRVIENYKDIGTLLRGCRRVGFTVRQGSTYLESQKSSLGRTRYSQLIDIAFPIVHGTHVEDGALQGFFETMNLPYAGPHVLGSAVGMDKYTSKVMLAHGGFPVLEAMRFSTRQWHEDAIASVVEESLEYPVIVKPVNLGSSVGIGKASNTTELRGCLDVAFSFARYVLVEPVVKNLKEINCAVVGDASSAEASECEEPVMNDEILSYTDKYASAGKTSTGASKGMASLKRKIPADISDAVRERIRTLAVDAFKHLDLAGVSRIDFLMDAVSEEIWINEINTIPGSLSYYLWEPLGWTYSQLLDRLVSLGLKRQREGEDLNYSFETNILAGSWTGLKGSKK
jgi:D-alanine-D-alanine ligase